MWGINFACITCCYVGQASCKFVGCNKELLFKKYAQNFHKLVHKSITMASKNYVVFRPDPFVIRQPASFEKTLDNVVVFKNGIV